jgi:succinate-acetate transporter protein
LSIQPNETSVTTLPPVADPGPLGLAAFALTTFLVSAFNAHWTRGTTAFLPFALGYGGLVQLLAGMWEFKRNNVFAATAFGTYGGFWIGVFFYFQLVALMPRPPLRSTTTSAGSSSPSRSSTPTCCSGAPR